MYNLNWLKPAIGGALFGAVLTIAIGFSVGGWVTGGTSERMIASNLSDGIALALTPYCIEKSKNDPSALIVIAEFKAASIYTRRSLIEKSGWATPLGTDQPNAALATACGDEIAKGL
jgi:hypothetical protein